MTWLSDPEDRELFKLGVFLAKIIEDKIDDVRDSIKSYTKEKWRSQSPSKRHTKLVNSKALISSRADSLSKAPIKTIPTLILEKSKIP